MRWHVAVYVAQDFDAPLRMPIALHHVVPGVFQGPESTNARATLRAAGITYVLSVGAKPPKDAEGLVCLRVGLEDAHNAPLDAVLPTCIEFIDAALAGGRSVLVHCKAGLSRSAAVVIGFLVVRRGLSVDAALTLLRQRTGRRVQPNDGFMAQLQGIAHVGAAEDAPATDGEQTEASATHDE